MDLRASTRDLQNTHFILDNRRQLFFAGGRQALIGQLKALGTITPQERQDLWDLVVKHKLFDAKSYPFTQGRTATYELTLHGMGERRSIRSVDDLAVGLSRLHRALLQLQMKYLQLD